MLKQKRILFRGQVDGKLYIKDCIMKGQYMVIMKFGYIHMDALNDGEKIIQALYYIVRNIPDFSVKLHRFFRNYLTAPISDKGNHNIKYVN